MDCSVYRIPIYWWLFIMPRRSFASLREFAVGIEAIEINVILQAYYYRFQITDDPTCICNGVKGSKHRTTFKSEEEILRRGIYLTCVSSDEQCCSYFIFWFHIWFISQLLWEKIWLNILNRCITPAEGIINISSGIEPKI